MATQIQFKRGLNVNFESVTLKSGEPAFVTDLGKLYIGNGTEKILINPIDKPKLINTTNFFTKFKVNEYGQVINTENTNIDDIPDLPYTKIIGLGSAAKLDVGTSAGNVPVLDDNGKLISSVLPPLAITNTFVVNSEKEMLTLNADIGDVAVRTDINESFILQKESADEINSWIKLLTPTDSVISVNGQTGVVSLAGSDILLPGYIKPSDYTAIQMSDSVSLGLGKLETNFSNYATILSPNFAGNPTAPTATLGNSSTTLATTEFVQIALSTIDGGIF